MTRDTNVAESWGATPCALAMPPSPPAGPLGAETLPDLLATAHHHTLQARSAARPLLPALAGLRVMVWATSPYRKRPQGPKGLAWPRFGVWYLPKRPKLVKGIRTAFCDALSCVPRIHGVLVQ